MPNPDTFLAAICDQPDDDAPRLVFADWLEENGDGARAEFIRTQIELARADGKSRGHERLLERQKLLLRRHKKEWTAPLKGIAERMEFARGFVMSLTLPAERFLRHAERIFQLAPVRSVTVTHSVGRTLDLAACKELARLTAISIQSIYATAQGIVAALGDPFSSRPSAVPYADDRIGDTGFADLVSSQHLTALAWLHVPSNNVTASSVRALVQAPVARQLRRLDLSHNPIGDAGFATLCAGDALQHLEWLDLSCCNIGVTPNEMLSMLLSQVRERAMKQPLPAIGVLADPRILPSLRYLNLQGNRVGEADRRALRTRFGANVHI